MSSLYKLVLKTNIKGPALAFPLVMPLIFALLYSVVIPNDITNVAEINNKVALFYVTILSMVTMQSGLMGFGINFIAIKKSILLRRIGATELSKMNVILAIILFGLTLYVITFIWIFVAMILLTSIGAFYSLQADGSHVSAQITGWLAIINWGKLILVTLIMLFTSYSVGMFFTTLAKDDQAYMGIAMMYFFFAGFFGGLMIPGEQPEWMNIVGYIVPHGYIDPLYDWVAGAIVGSGSGQIAIWEFSLGFIIPILIGILALIGSAKFLKFD